MTAINNSYPTIKKQPLFLLLIMLVLSIQLQYAQNKTFKHYGLPEGLPQETIHCLAKDSLGYLWIGTSSGVGRFDGHDFITINNEDLEGLLINDLQADLQQNIWIATSQNGVYTYNYSTEKQQQIGITNSNATSIVCDKKGAAYVSYFNEGIYKIYKHNTEYKSEKLYFKNLYKKQITSLLLVKNHILFGTNAGELFVFENKTKNKTPFVKIKSYNLLGNINKLVLINNDIWVCSSKGLFLLSNDFKTLTPVSLNKTVPNNKNNFNFLILLKKKIFIL